MLNRRDDLPLVAAFAASVLLHAGVVIGWLAIESAEAEPPTADIAINDPFRLGERAPEDEVELGIDEGEPSSLTWIGYREYEQHLAQLSEVEQAAFRDDPAAGDGGVRPGPDGAPAPTPPAMVEPTPAVVNSTEAPAGSPAPLPPLRSGDVEASMGTDATPLPPITDPTATPSDDTSLPPIPAVEAPASEPIAGPVVPVREPVTMPGVADAPSIPPLPEGEGAVTPAATTPLPESPEKADAVEEPTRPPEIVPEPAAVQGPPAPEQAPNEPTPEEPAEPARETPTDPAKPVEDPPTPQPEQPETPKPTGDGTPGPPSLSEPTSGDQADRESDASSVIDVPREFWQAGKPLAAPGIEIRPRRPHFTELTRLTTAPRNPLVEISFDRSGVSKQPRILRSSGDARVDGPILDSLYRWRAAGARLEALAPGEVLKIRMRILIVGE